MDGISGDLERAVAEADGRLQAVSGEASALPLAPGKWCRREVLGHLVDSAANNHQRFVRVQFTDGLSLPGYAQDDWVRCQGYREESWASLVALWRAYNLRLARVVERIPAAALAHRCTIGGGAPVTLRWVAEDYVRHLRHHLGQILDGE